MFFRRPLLIPLFVLALAPAAVSQEAAPAGRILPPSPRLKTGAGTPGTLPQDNRSPTPESPLMPDQTPSLVKPETVPSEPPASEAEKKRTKLSKTEVFEQDQAVKIRFRQVHTQALADRTLEELWDKANAARKDVDKRTILKAYYKHLYARMAKIDPSLKPQIDLQAAVAEKRLTQARLTPTEVADESERSTAARAFAE
jgi:hypothetical protein